MVFRLYPDNYSFPPPHLGEADGLLAVGGDLKPERLLNAYRWGIFPWSAYEREELAWWCPMDRFVIFPNEIHVSHSMRNMINRGEHMTTMDRNFETVIRNCAAGSCGQLRIGEPGAWLGPEIIEAYTALHRMGIAHSIEVWRIKDRRDEKEIKELVGGLYGIIIGRVFVGESMFSDEPNASKLGLISLARHMEEANGFMIDCQLHTPHLESMGGRFISYKDYMTILELGLGINK